MNYGTVRAVSTTYACVANDFTLECDATAAPFTVTLPTLNLEPGRTIRVIKKDAGANAITIAAPGGYTIETNLSDATVNAKDDQITLQLGTGTIWYGVEQAEKLVNCQASTPGTAQTGNANLSGTIIGGTLVKSGAGVEATTTVTAGTGVTATTGDIAASAGSVKANGNASEISVTSAADADNRVVATADGTTATCAAWSPSGLKSVQMVAVDGGGHLDIDGNQIIAIQQAAEASVVAAGVTTPANVAYIQADQTALADAVLELKTTVNSLLGKLRTHGLIAT